MWYCYNCNNGFMYPLYDSCPFCASDRIKEDDEGVDLSKQRVTETEPSEFKNCADWKAK